MKAQMVAFLNPQDYPRSLVLPSLYKMFSATHGYECALTIDDS